MGVTLLEGFGKRYLIAGLSCDVYDRDSFVTIYRGETPVATMQRRRMYQDGPQWVAFDLTGKRLADTGRIGTVVGVLKKVAESAAPSVEAATAEPAIFESRPYGWRELTAEEQREATERGFPRGSDVRYVTNLSAKAHAAPRQWQLVRWTRVGSVAAAPVAAPAPAADGAASDAALDAFDSVMRAGMFDPGKPSVRELRRKAMAAALAAGIAAIGAPAKADSSRVPLADVVPGMTICHYGAPVHVITAPQAREGGRPGYDFLLIRYTIPKIRGELGVAVIRRGEVVDLAPGCKGKGF